MWHVSCGTFQSNIKWLSKMGTCSGPLGLYNSKFFLSFQNRGSAVGIATGYRLDDKGIGVRVPVG
jgi:hypothetical protein